MNEIIPYYEAAKVVIVPVTSGTGVSIKFIEALCSGRLLVASTGAFRGLSSHVTAQLPLKGYDVPTEFFEAMMAALRSRDQSLAACAEVYDNELSFARYLATLSRIAGL